MNPLIQFAVKKEIAKSALLEVERKTRLSELESPYKSQLGQCGRAFAVDRASALESRRPEQTALDAVSRLRERDFTLERWQGADIEERKRIVCDASRILSQELLMDSDTRAGIQIRFDDGTRQRDEGQIIHIGRPALQSRDCGEVYGQLYRALLDMDAQNSGIVQEADAHTLQCSFISAYRKAEGIENAPSRRADNLGNWKELHDKLDSQANLREVNPNYELDAKWKINCQRCVPTYEMRMRGYDVTTKPCLEWGDSLALRPFDVWVKPEIHIAKGNGREEIENAMREWGDGVRAQVVVHWQFGHGGHTFIAEQRDGVTHFLDPQSAEEDVSYYFEEVAPDCTQFCRIDTLQPSQRILDCCKAT